MRFREELKATICLLVWATLAQFAFSGPINWENLTDLSGNLITANSGAQDFKVGEVSGEDVVLRLTLTGNGTGIGLNGERLEVAYGQTGSYRLEGELLPPHERISFRLRNRNVFANPTGSVFQTFSMTADAAITERQYPSTGNTGVAIIGGGGTQSVTHTTIPNPSMGETSQGQFVFVGSTFSAEFSGTSSSSTVAFTDAFQLEVSFLLSAEPKWMPTDTQKRLTAVFPGSPIEFFDPLKETYSASGAYEDSGSEWSVSFPEEHVFRCRLTHEDTVNPDQSWSLGVGQGGQIYSLIGSFGESVPPQFRDPLTADADYAPWVDEVWQTVAVDLDQNRLPDLTYFIHQAGVYLKRPQEVFEPFYSPVVAEYSDPVDRSYTIVNWGQQAHIEQDPSLTKSELLFYTKYRDLGGGVIEVSSGFFNFGEDTINFLNCPWGGVRRSALEYHFTTSPDGSTTQASGQFGAPNVIPATGTGGWAAFSGSQDGSSPALGLVFGRGGTSSYLDYRHGYAGGSASLPTGISPIEWRNYYVIAPRRRSISITRGKSLGWRYYLAVHSDIGSLAQQISSNALASHAGDFSIATSSSDNYLLNFAPNVSAGSGEVDLDESCVPSEHQLYSLPIEGGYPLFFVQLETGEEFVTTTPHAVLSVGFRREHSSIRLLGYAVDSDHVAAAPSHENYAPIEGLFSSNSSRYAANGRVLFVRNEEINPPYITDLSVDQSSGTADVTFDSSPYRSYRITYGGDLEVFDTVLVDGIVGDPMSLETTETVPVSTNQGHGFFRVEIP